jgi:hypothetical protein
LSEDGQPCFGPYIAVTDTDDLVLFLIFASRMSFHYIGIITAEGIQYQPSRENRSGGDWKWIPEHVES